MKVLNFLRILLLTLFLSVKIFVQSSKDKNDESNIISNDVQNEESVILGEKKIKIFHGKDYKLADHWHEKIWQTYLMPFLDIKMKFNLRETCKLFASKFPQPEYMLFKNNAGGIARLEINFYFVETQGTLTNGGDSSAVREYLESNVLSLVHTHDAFAVLKRNGSVITWGNPKHGGDSSMVQEYLQSGIKKIFSTSYAFTALKENGTVITWGDRFWGGNSANVQHKLSGVEDIYCTAGAFAALKSNGNVVAWGYDDRGGQNDAEEVEEDLRSGGILTISSTKSAFAALRGDGRVITWGNSLEGGDCKKVRLYLQSGVVQIFSTHRAFAALKENGSVFSWGDPEEGGNSSGLDLHLGVKKIVSTHGAFAALKENGSVIAWGHSYFGGYTSNVRHLLLDGVVKLEAIRNRKFLATKDDGSQVEW